jgi:hypothetical protein
MLVDYERAWLGLKGKIAEKRSHGQKDLAVTMANLEVEHMLDNDAAPPEATQERATTEPDSSDAGMPTTNPLLAQEARNGNHREKHPVG